MPRAFSGGLVCALPPRPIACFAVPATRSCRVGCGVAAIAKFGQHNRAIHADLQLVRVIVPHPWRLVYPCLSVAHPSLNGNILARAAVPPSFFRPADCIGKTIHTLITKKRVTSAASVPAAAADKAKRRPPGASASGRAKSQERSVPALALVRASAALARKRQARAVAR